MEALRITALGEEILCGHQVTYEEALALTNTETVDIPLLGAYAHKIRSKFAGDRVDMCGIVNARSGMCSEDCKFCAQSVYHQTDAPVYPLLNQEQLIVAAKKAEVEGAGRVSLVTSGKGMPRDPDFPLIVEALRLIMQETSLKVCANLGTLTPEQATALAGAGVKRYAHNLETSAGYYPKICTTHPYEERLATLRAVQASGMELCTGGIIGLGETWADRIDMAFALRFFDVASVPINILNPLKGTALQSMQPLAPLEILKTFAIFRFILPSKTIRPAGGRELNLRDLQGALMLSGANGLIVGNYLTFTGRNSKSDFTMIRDVELYPAD